MQSLNRVWRKFADLGLKVWEVFGFWFEGLGLGGNEGARHGGVSI